MKINKEEDSSRLLRWYLRYHGEEEWKGEGHYALDSITYQQVKEVEDEPGFIRHCPEIVGWPTVSQWKDIMIEVAELMSQEES